MKIRRAISVCFSPAFHTSAVQKRLLATLPYASEEWDLTPREAAEMTLPELNADDLLLLGAPVYAGRIPGPAAERFGRLQGQSTPVILLATFGNRAFEDALLEMQDLLEARGFVVVGAAALVTEHSIAIGYAADRPDGEDDEALQRFADSCAQRIAGADDPQDIAVQAPGNRPYRESGGKNNVPAADESCTRCGLCARSCPVGAIDGGNLQASDPALCFGCMRCVWVCPVRARHIPEEDTQRIRRFLQGVEPARKANYFCG